MTRAQERAWRELWPRYGLEADDEDGLAEALAGDRRKIIEVGFGNGESLLAQAAETPDADFLGIEVHEPGIGHCLLGIERDGLDNLTLVCGDAMEILGRLPASSTDRIDLYFPDPWPKKRHHKRRIVGPRFLDLVARLLKPGGALHLATDWAGYAEHIDETLDADGRFRLLERREHGGDAPLERPVTKFEQRGSRLGHRIVDWIYERSGSTA